MKKNVLALSIAAMIGGLGFAGMASASVIVGTGTGVTNTLLTTPNVTGFKFADGGVGHALVVPYYTVQNGNMTVLHLTNTDMKNGKVAKIRFRGAANSDDVLDFQVLLSPGDVWTAAISKNADGLASLTTGDTTCTIPAIGAQSVAFKTSRLDPALSPEAAAEGTREGYVEILNSADIPSDKVYTVGATATTNSALYSTIKHTAGKPACAAATIEAALFTTDFTAQADAAKIGLNSPSGGLMADWYIINVPQTTTYSGAATALVGVKAGVAPGTIVPATYGNYVAFPQNESMVIALPETFTADPSLASVGVSSYKKTSAGVTSDPTTVAPIEAIALDFPDLSTPYYAAAGAAAALTQASVLTQALAVSSITNQYAKDAGIFAKTDWVLSMPTRRYSVAVDYNAKNALGAVAAARVYSKVPGAVGGAGLAQEYFSTDNTELVNGKVCVGTQGTTFLDREETGKSGSPVFSPSKASSARLCGEASVLSFAEGLTAPSVLGASVAREDAPASALFENGWGVLNTANYPKGTAPAAQAAASIGMPILGYSVIKLTNPQATAGVSGNFGITWPHRFTKVNP